VQALYARKRLDPPLPFEDWLARGADARMISVMPLSVEVVLALDALPASFTVILLTA
jgi:PIN domain nuclease of toxin-antitoxin system